VFPSVPVLPKRFRPYEKIIGEEQTEQIRELARELRGARVLHINATAFGGGVAELLGTLVPLMRNLGLEADWQVMYGSDEFFAVTKMMHNALQGADLWRPQMGQVWKRYQQENARHWDQTYDFTVIHDPQPAGIPVFLRDAGRPIEGGLTWRCHIDLTESQPDVWRFLYPYLAEYRSLIFTHASYVKRQLRGRDIRIAPPAIDPLSPKNADLRDSTVREILERYGIDQDRPIICQVSRFDPWKDPLGVIDVYRLLKPRIPGLQLVMVASMATDDPEGWEYYERTVRRAGEDFDIHILSNVNGVGHTEVNAFQRASTVLLQKSVREGFGLTVSEGLWKRRPVVAGNVGGIPLQVSDGVTGFLIDNVEQCAERVEQLIHDPELGVRMGEAGHEHVKRHFLITRYLLDYLHIFHDQLQGNGTSHRPASRPAAVTEAVG
jgi:trehalose synthase